MPLHCIRTSNRPSGSRGPAQLNTDPTGRSTYGRHGHGEKALTTPHSDRNKKISMARTKGHAVHMGALRTVSLQAICLANRFLSIRLSVAQSCVLLKKCRSDRRLKEVPHASSCMLHAGTERERKQVAIHRDRSPRQHEALAQLGH